MFVFLIVVLMRKAKSQNKSGKRFCNKFHIIISIASSYCLLFSALGDSLAFFFSLQQLLLVHWRIRENYQWTWINIEQLNAVIDRHCTHQSGNIQVGRRIPVTGISFHLVYIFKLYQSSVGRSQGGTISTHLLHVNQPTLPIKCGYGQNH